MSPLRRWNHVLASVVTFAGLTSTLVAPLKLGSLALAADTPAASSTQVSSKVSAELQTQVIQRYAELVYATYTDLHKSTQNLNVAVAVFIKKPSVKTHEKAKNAWKESRIIYSLTEPFRFYGGPIDDPKTGVEGLVNSWPVDEAYLDSVQGNASAGLVNNAKLYPEITKELLLSANQKEGEKNISTGYHAVEFLLWGQDRSTKTAGTRNFKDYVDNGKNNATRRGTSLKLLSEILVEHSATLVEAWKPNVANNYAAAFLATDSKEVLRRTMTGLASLSLDELAGERMIVALEKNDQEQEQDCFSDFTTFDLVQNAVAIRDVFQGTYKNTKGPGLVDIVKAVDPDTAAKLVEQLNASVGRLKTIPAPFDKILVSSPKSPLRKKVTAAVDSLEAQGKLFAKAGRILGLTLNVQE